MSDDLDYAPINIEYREDRSYGGVRVDYILPVKENGRKLNLLRSVTYCSTGDEDGFKDDLDKALAFCGHWDLTPNPGTVVEFMKERGLEDDRIAARAS